MVEFLRTNRATPAFENRLAGIRARDAEDQAAAVASEDRAAAIALDRALAAGIADQTARNTGGAAAPVSPRAAPPAGPGGAGAPTPPADSRLNPNAGGSTQGSLSAAPAPAGPVAAPAGPAPQAPAPTPGPAIGYSANPVVSSLVGSGAHGSGAAALQAQQQQDEWERLAVQALATGDTTTAQHYAGRAGMQIPPEIMGDARMRELWGRAALVAEKFYRDNPKQAGQFVAAYVRSGGDPMAAYGQVGAPLGKPNITAETVLRGDRQVLAFVDSANKTVTYAQDPGGQDVRMPGTAANTSADMQLIGAIQAQGYSFDEAFRMARLARSNPMKLEADVAEGLYDGAAGDIRDRRTPDEKLRWAQQEARGFVQGLEQQTFGTPAAPAAAPSAPSAPAAPQPAAPAPPASGAPQSPAAGAAPTSPRPQVRLPAANPPAQQGATEPSPYQPLHRRFAPVDVPDFAPAPPQPAAQPTPAAQPDFVWDPVNRRLVPAPR